MKEQKMIEYYRKQIKNSDWILPENKYRME